MNKYLRFFGVILVSTIIYSCSGEQKPADRFLNPDSKKDEAVSKYKAGEAIYKTTCMPCHQADGKGMKGAFPPLAGSDYLMEDIDRAISQIIYGSEGEMTVNGIVYSGIMAPQGLEDEAVKDVMNYILNSWGNNGGEVTLDDVKAQKK